MTPISFSELPPTQNHPPASPSRKEKTAPQSTETTSDVEITKSNLPIVVLDVEVVTDSIAARLATSLLGHVLFLKNQIPLPIMQLVRVPNKQGSNKVNKLKVDMLSTFDTLTSHLLTTFSALSTALAKNSSLSGSATLSRVYLAILVGPSLGAPKSKVIYGVDKFETRIWGSVDPSKEEEAEESDSSGDEVPEDSEDGESDEEGDLEPGYEGSDRRDLENEWIFEELEDQETECEGEDDNASHQKQENCAQNLLVPPPSPYNSYAEEQRFLQNADRLLARMLSSADVNDNGLANEMSPSQTHILIRAPRRFTHPAWIPRQNLTKQMETSLTNFLGATWPLSPESSSRPAKKQKQTEGVWITGRGGLGTVASPTEHSLTQEEDEMIWWSWDGKLVGFADW